MRATSTLGAQTQSPRRLLLATGIGVTLILLAIGGWRIYRAWNFSGGPFLDFEIRLPKGILLPDDKNIQATLWSGQIGRGCSIKVQRALDPIDIVGRCGIMTYLGSNVLSVRLSNYAEGWWDVPNLKSIGQGPAFGSWQPIEFIGAPAGPSEVSSLPFGEYSVRYMVRR
jgi:hypothetical protein